MATFMIYLIGTVALAGYLQNELVALIWRSTKVVLSMFILFSICLTSYYHFRYLLKTGLDLSFQQILFFYVTGIVIFGAIYNQLYFLDYNFFNYPNPIIIPPPQLMNPGLDGLILVLDFLAYSACVSLSIDYTRISSGASSAIVPIVNIIEVLFSLVFVALFISMFVQKSSSSNENSTTINADENIN